MASDTYGAILLTTANDVGAMLQKKMATPSETYAPAVWAETINLLGKLPEATVSGSIVTFADGADDVPLKSCEVALPASLDGYSSVDVVHCGKNLFNYEDVEAFNANVIITRNDGDYTMQNNNSYGVGAFRGISFHLKPSSYSISIGEALSVPIQIYKNDAWFNNGINTGDTSCTFTVTEEADYTLSCTVSANSSLTIKKCQFEVGSQASAFEQYQTPTTHTVNLGRTIYGGSVDVVKGEGTDENGNDFTFEPVEISSRLGDNTIWSDGDMNVTYRRDIDLALQALSGSRGLMMARPPAAAETEETEPEDETTETIEETPEDMEK